MVSRFSTSNISLLPKIPTYMYSYCYNNPVTLLNAAIRLKFNIANFKNLKFTSICLPANLP